MEFPGIPWHAGLARTSEELLARMLAGVQMFRHLRGAFAVESVGMPKRSKLRLTIATPCPASWDDMEGDDRVRFCPECELNVYNLSAMTEEQALALVQEREGRLCVRLYQREDGTVLTSDCPVGAHREAPIIGGIDRMGP